MSYSLQSREIIADSVETVMGAQWYDGNISIPGCDKNMPGVMIAMGRLNRPSLMVYGGTIRAGHLGDKSLDIISAFQSYGEFITGKIEEEERSEIVKKSCPGAGVDPEKMDECVRAGAAMLNLLEKDIKPRDIMTRDAFENAMVIVMALGGSTNAVLHLLAMARAVDVELKIEDFQSVSDRIPFIADLKPSGKYVMEDLHAIGGIPAVMKYLLEAGLINGDCMTVTGKTIKENLADLPGLKEGQDIIMPLDKPIKESGHIRILKGNLAPGASVAKITGKEGLTFIGPARVYDCEEDMLAGLEKNEIQKGDVIVIRYEGPKGGPGMPEMLTPTSAIMGAGLGSDVAMITDGRFSGGSHGFIIGHVVPEAQEGGPIALIQNGDVITVDANTNSLSVNLTDDELAKRKKAWVMPAYKATRGTLYKFIKSVKDASHGCVTDE